MSRLSTICVLSASVFFTVPAFAFSTSSPAVPLTQGNIVKVACNPGAPNCVTSDPVRNKIKAGAAAAINNPIGQEQGCKGNGLCGNDSGGNPSPVPNTKTVPTKVQSQTSTQAAAKAGSGGGKH